MIRGWSVFSSARYRVPESTRAPADAPKAPFFRATSHAATHKMRRRRWRRAV
jgi:hypothetical protein